MMHNIWKIAVLQENFMIKLDPTLFKLTCYLVYVYITFSTYMQTLDRERQSGLPESSVYYSVIIFN